VFFFFFFVFLLAQKKKKKKRGKERKEKEKDSQKIEANKSKIRTKATVKYFLQQSTHLFQVRLFSLSLSLSLSPSLSVGALFIVGAPRQNDQISGIPPQFQSFFFSLCVSPNSTEFKSLS
jgi:hypothetical protein